MSEPSSHGISPVELKANCEKCYGLCCVALPFTASADFAFTKDAGEPCRNLLDDFRCGIHDVLRPSGFAGCTVYDCFGAGQQVSQEIYPGRDWRAGPEAASEMFAVFRVVRQLHELLWYLEEALTLTPEESPSKESPPEESPPKGSPPKGSLRRRLNAALDAITVLVSAPPAKLLAFDVAAQRSSIAVLLLQTSSNVRAAVAGDRKQQRRIQHAGADLLGASLSHSNQRGADFRGAYLIGADLQGADLHLADLLGADLRATNLRGANLSTAIFLTQFQLNAAHGDGSTRFPARLTRPNHWRA